jgi:uncharacterized phage-like protein YoqJ
MILAATGHRMDKLGGYNAHTLGALFDFACWWLTQRPAGKYPTRIISGMAQGWDTAIAWAALTHGIPLTAAVPFATQSLTWPQASRKFYGELIAQADRVVILSPPPASEAYMRLAMHTRNKWMVDNCDEVVALWNGTSGGTKHCVEYCHDVDRLYSNPWHEWLKWRDRAK